MFTLSSTLLIYTTMTVMAPVISFFYYSPLEASIFV
jgi:hypothetical protein